MPRRIHTGSGPNPGSHQEGANNDWEVTNLGRVAETGEFTVPIDLPGSTIDTCYRIFVLTSGLYSSEDGIGSGYISSIYDDQPKPPTRRCYECYTEDWFTEPGSADVGWIATADPGGEASRFAPWCSADSRLLTRPMPAGTKITVNFGNYAATYMTFLLVKGGTPSDIGMDSESSPNGFDGWESGNDIIYLNPADTENGALILIATAGTGLYEVHNCGLTHFGWNGGGSGWDGSSSTVTHITTDEMPYRGSGVAVDYPLVPPCIGSAFTFRCNISWHYAIVAEGATSFDPGFTGIPDWIFEKMGYSVQAGSNTGPPCCSRAIRVAQHHHAPNSE